MKIFAKRILSRLAFSTDFYYVVEKAFNFMTLMRFQEISRTQLVAIYEQISIKKNNKNFRLIRVGSSHDGGYVMVNPISPFCNVISLGIADNMDFELALVKEKLVDSIFCFDGSIEKLPIENEKINFEPKYIKVFESENSLTLSQVLAGVEGDEVILKIDIEGDEWEVLGNLEESELRRFTQIVGEFHGLASSTSNMEIRKKVELLQRISQDFHLVNSHPNNWSRYRIIQGIAIPDVVELTFIKKKVFEPFPESTFLASSKNDLNAPCNPDKPEYLF